MTFDDWGNIVTANACWMNLVLVIIILVGFYRKYRGECIRKECELLARTEIEKLKKELVEEIKAKEKLEMEVKHFRTIFKRLPLIVNNTITLPDMEAFHFYMQLKITPVVGADCQVKEWDKLFHFLDIISNDFYSRLIDRYPQLGRKELCLSCLVRLRFSNQEIAALFGIKEGSVVRSKNRLRKLLNINEFQTMCGLDEYILKY